MYIPIATSIQSYTLYHEYNYYNPYPIVNDPTSNLEYVTQCVKDKAQASCSSWCCRAKAPKPKRGRAPRARPNAYYVSPPHTFRAPHHGTTTERHDGARGTVPVPVRPPAIRPFTAVAVSSLWPARTPEASLVRLCRWAAERKRAASRSWLRGVQPAEAADGRRTQRPPRGGRWSTPQTTIHTKEGWWGLEGWWGRSAAGATEGEGGRAESSDRRDRRGGRGGAAHGAARRKTAAAAYSAA